jgi:hypothetical protein
MNEIEQLMIEKFGWEPIPSILYKYRTWSDTFHKRLLTDQELYFPSPLSFNDPFDCSVLLTIVSPKRDIIRKSYYLINHDFPELPRAERRKRATKIRLEKHYKNDEELKRTRKLNLENDYGVCSLTTNNANLVMWSHYADSHKGFCVGLDLNQIVYDKDTQEQFLKEAKIMVRCYEVHYYKEYPILEFHLDQRPDIESAMEAVQPLLAKSENWSYENEWRLITFFRNKFFIKFKKTALKYLYLGCMMKETTKREILEIVQSNYPSLEVYQSKMKEKEFGLDFQRII